MWPFSRTVKPTDLETFRRDLARAWGVRALIDWTARPFVKEKAFVAGVFSKIAYLVLPDYELADHSVVKPIPCFTYQELLSRRQPFDLRTFLKSAEVDTLNLFVLSTDHAVAVGVARPEVILVALRGTRPTYMGDWWIDAKAGHRRLMVGGHRCVFHAGFYDAVNEFLPALANWIRDYGARQRDRPPVYVVGHSLGGAMTAIVGALDGLSVLAAGDAISTQRPHLGVHSAYTFGMPRYGDKSVIANLPRPFHTYSPLDIVPCLPTNSIGFADCDTEYCLDTRGLTQVVSRPARGLTTVIQRIDVRNHFMDHYVEQLARP